MHRATQIIFAAALAACTSPVDASLTAGEPTVGVVAPRVAFYRDYIFATVTPRSEGDVERIWRLAEYVLAPHDPGFALHELVILPSTFARLEGEGVPLRLEPIDVQAMIDASYESDEAERTPHAGALGPYFDKVQQLDAIYAYLDELAAASQGRARVVNLGKSIQNRDVKAIRISSAAEDNARPSVIVTGTQHAREFASPMVTSGLADGLVRQYDTDPRVKQVVDALEIFIVPVTNPDGYVAAHAGQRLQRKNMNPRCNVHLNRNWGEWWGIGTPRGSCSAETFPGDSAFSEPETQAVRRLAESRTALRYYVDYHSCANQVMYPMCFERTAPPNQAEDIAWTQLYSQTFREVHGRSLPSQPCFAIGGGEGGCSHDWFRKRLPNVMEVELPPGGNPSGFGIADSAVVTFVEENWAAWLAVLTKVAAKNSGDAGAPFPLRDAQADAPYDGADSGPRADATAEDSAGGDARSVDAGAAGVGASGAGGSAAGSGGGAGSKVSVGAVAATTTTTGGNAGSGVTASGGGGSASMQPSSTEAVASCSCRLGTRSSDRSGAVLALLAAATTLLRRGRVQRQRRDKAGNLRPGHCNCQGVTW